MYSRIDLLDSFIPDIRKLVWAKLLLTAKLQRLVQSIGPVVICVQSGEVKWIININRMGVVINTFSATLHVSYHI